MHKILYRPKFCSLDPKRGQIILFYFFILPHHKYNENNKKRIERIMNYVIQSRSVVIYVWIENGAKELKSRPKRSRR